MEAIGGTYAQTDCEQIFAICIVWDNGLANSDCQWIELLTKLHFERYYGSHASILPKIRIWLPAIIMTFRNWCYTVGESVRQVVIKREFFLEHSM